MLVLVWEYMARPEAVEEFESLYRPDGPWVELFRRSPGFISTTLMKDLRDPLRYMIADRWTSEAAYETFQRENADDYKALSERGARLFRMEHPVGRFDFLD